MRKVHEERFEVVKRIVISESQAKMLSEAGLPLETRSALPSFMGSNPFEGTGYFVHGVIDRMLAKRNLETQQYFSDDINSYEKSKVFGKLSKLIEKCKRLEEPIRPELEKICNNVVVKIFGIPENAVEIKCELIENIPPGEQFHITPDTDEGYEYEDVTEMENSDSDISKRRIVNALAYGAANRMAEQAGRLWVNEVFELNEELPHLYSKIMKINEYLVFNTDVKIKDKSHKQGGAVKVTLTHEGEIASIHSRGIIFPILMQETVRGVADIIASYGLPDDMGAAERIMNIADALENDPWNMRMGPIMWDAVCSSVDKFETENFPYFFKELVSVPSADFQTLMKNVFAGTKRGKSDIASLYAKAEYNGGYEKFANDLALKQGKDVIEDEYFTEEELEEGIYDYGE